MSHHHTFGICRLTTTLCAASHRMITGFIAEGRVRGRFPSDVQHQLLYMLKKMIFATTVPKVAVIKS